MNPSNSSKKRGTDISITKFPCKLCTKYVSDNDNAILYDLCQTWIHIKCNQRNYIGYQYLQGKVVMNYDIAFLVPQHSFHLVI